MRQRQRQEMFRRPVPEASTRPSSAPADEEVVDLQLQQAVTTMVGLLVLQGDNAPAPRWPVRPLTTQAAAPEQPKENPDSVDQLQDGLIDPIDPDPRQDGDSENEQPTTLPTTVPANK